VDFIDVYNNAILKYPLAWNALYKIANTTEQICEFEQNFSDNTLLNTKILTVKTSIGKTVFDGFSLEIEPPLLERLNIIRSNAGVLYVDCSKMLTRNFEKFLYVLQQILESNGEFCTSNYYISNQLLEKRARFLKAAHNEREVREKLQMISRATPNIKRCMESFQ